MKHKDKEVMTRAVGGLAKSAIMDFNDLKSDHETKMKEKDDRIKELKKMIGGFEDIVLEELHKQIAALKDALSKAREDTDLLWKERDELKTENSRQAEEIERLKKRPSMTREQAHLIMDAAKLLRDSAGVLYKDQASTLREEVKE